MNRKEKRIKRKTKIRRIVVGDSKRPRLMVFRSSQHIYAQLIDDSKGVTIAFASDLKEKDKGAKTERAFTVGKKVAEQAKTKGVESVVFDRGGFIYHGRVAKVAEGAREGGLKF